MASNGQYSAQKPQFMQISTSMKNFSGSGTGRPVFGSLVRTIQIHCGGATLAEQPHDVRRSLPTPLTMPLPNIPSISVTPFEPSGVFLDLRRLKRSAVCFSQYDIDRP